jgi:tripartite-type tricarboxylate transporter receptor subunit TctC
MLSKNELIDSKIELFLYGRAGHVSIRRFNSGKRSEEHMRADLVIHRISPRRLLLATFLGICTAGSATAQSFPSSVIRIVVPPGPGTPPDIISRIVADELAQAEGWRVIVENRPGALQTIAMADVARHPGDGYAILAMSVPMMATPTLLPKAGLRPEVDFAPIIKISTSYTALVVTPSLPANSVSELVSLLKGKPGQLNFSSAGFGTPSHLIGEMFQLETGIQATHVPYQQFPQAIADLVAGTNHYMFSTTLPVIDLIATGKLRALAVTAPRRIAALSETPSIAEVGFPGLVMEDWLGFAVRNDTEPKIIAQLNQAINKVLATPKVHGALAKIGAESAGGTPAEFGHLINTQVAHWAKVITQANIKLPQ